MKKMVFIMTHKQHVVILFFITHKNIFYCHKNYYFPIFICITQTPIFVKYTAQKN